MEKNPHLRLLLIEDSVDDAFLVQREIRRGGFALTCAHVDSLENLREALSGSLFDLAITDYSLPGFTGLTAIQTIREFEPELPVLMVSGTIDEETAVSALHAGASDFLVKGRLARLLPAIERALMVKRARADQRAAEEAAERAREAMVIADAKTKAKSEFLANVCHELRTPLNAILGFSELLSQEVDGPLTSRQREHVQNVLEGGRHLLALINDSLDMSKIEANRMDLAIEPTSIARVTETLQSAMASLVEQRGLRLRVDIPPNLPPVAADPLRLKQIFYNLLSNACKFTSPGGTISLSAVAVDDAVRMSVEDTGIGIRANDLTRLFQEYEQLDLPRRTRLDGTGLGLALTRRLVELHGGRITVESEYGRGSTFTVVLPIAAGAVRPSAAPHVSDASSGTARRIARILVVEDDPLSSLLARILLERRGHVVVPVSTLDEARGLLQLAQPDVVLTDLQLADGDGEDLLRTIRADPATRDLRVVAITADAMPGVRDRLLTLGFDGYLSKPVDARTFPTTIEGFLPPSTE